MTKFVVTAKHPSTGDSLKLFYNNETNILHTESGFVFHNPSTADQNNTLSLPFSKDMPLRKSKHVQILKVQLGLSCNYSCDYCSQRFVERAPETSKKDIDAFLAKLDNLEFNEERGLGIEFWGGEPLVYWKTLRPLAERLHEKFDSWKKKPKFSIITNGSILTPEICYWLLVNNFSVGISHDGPGQAIRGPDPFDDPEQKKIILDFYRAMRKDKRISFNSMLTASNYSRKEIYEWFVELTGDPDVILGEGSVVDAYDDGGMNNLLDTKKKHFEFRKTAFNDIFSTEAKIGFYLAPLKIDGFIKDVLSHSPAIKTGQKCGMDRENTIAIDLKGNVITCQNVSHVQVSHNGESHHAGNIEDIEAVRIKTATHWSNRPACAECPVLHICKGSCMFIEGNNWTASCDSAYSDAVVFFALAIAKMTNGFIPTLIESENLPAERMDIWGDVFKHEEKPKLKAFPVKVVSVKKDVEGVEVYSKSAVVEV